MIFSKKSQTAMEFLMNYGWALFIVLIVIASLVYFGVLDSDNYLPDKIDLSQGISIESASIDENSVTFVLRNDLGKDVYDFQFNASGCNDGAGGLSDPINLTAGKLKKVTFYCEHDYDQGDKLDSDLSATWKTKTSTKGSSYDFDHVARGSIKVAVSLGKALMDQVSVSSPGILDGSNTVYTMTDNITDNSLTSPMFTINGSNVIFDCNGYVISSDDAYAGIYSIGQNNLTIRNCEIDMSSDSGGHGIQLNGITNSLVFNNTVSNQKIGIYVYGSSSNITVSGNTANSNTGDGIYFNKGYNSTVGNNTANSNGAKGLQLYNSSYNIIENNTFNSNQNNGGLQLRYSTYNNFTNNNITGNNNYGIWLWEYSSYNNFVNINATATSGYKRAVYFRDYSGSNNFTNSSFSDPTQSYDPMLMSTATNNNFVNCSYTLAKEYVCSACDMERRWYYRVYVNDSDGDPVEGAIVKAYDKNSVLRLTMTTDSNGLSPLGELTEYRRVSSTSTDYYPYNITVTKDDYYGEHINYNHVGNLINDSITLETCQPGGSMTGLGTVDRPFQICDCTMLQDMNDSLLTHYVLTQDIDCSDTINWNSGAGFAPIGKFNGTLDGQNYTVNSLYINRPAEVGVGLFLSLGGGANITNVGVIDANLTGYRYVGALVGSFGNATVSNCWSSGSISGTYADQVKVGGLIGAASGNDTYTLECHSNATASGVGGHQIGGLSGYNGHGAVLNNSYATGTVSGLWKIGGLVGDNLGGAEGTIIDNSYSVGYVSYTSGGGGLVGFNYLSGVTTNSFWDKETSTRTTSYGGTGKTTLDMKNNSTFISAGWDYTNIWQQSPGEYPTLRRTSS